MITLLVALTAFTAAAPAPDGVGRPTVATHYFYWYHWPSEHFAEPGAPGREGHTRHFPEPERVSYRSSKWHEQNFREMGEAGIDVALPVYWGAPGAYDRPNLAFSRQGLPKMVEALDRLSEGGEAAPKVGLFYDTSTLANDVCGREPRGARADLTTAAGRDLFCSTITDYFAEIPIRHWARHRGGALVVLYAAAFSSGFDRSLADVLRERFAARFGGEGLLVETYRLDHARLANRENGGADFRLVLPGRGRDDRTSPQGSHRRAPEAVCYRPARRMTAAPRGDGPKASRT